MTIEYPVQQGTPEWMRARLGIPTSSCFHLIVTPKKGELSRSSIKYAYKLVAERLLNEPMEPLEGQEWLERGKALEPSAVRQYQFVHEVETRPAGFFTTNDRRYGASPDRVIIGKSAGVEIKAPAPWTHIGYLLDGPGTDYRPQVQGQLDVCEWEFVDFYSYHDRMPAAPLRTYRDEDFIKLLRAALAQFDENLLTMLDRAKALGVFQAQREAHAPAELAHARELSAELLDEHGLMP